MSTLDPGDNDNPNKNTMEELTQEQINTLKSLPLEAQFKFHSGIKEARSANFNQLLALFSHLLLLYLAQQKVFKELKL